MIELKNFIASIEKIPSILYESKDAKTLIGSIDLIKDNYIRAIDSLSDALFSNHRAISKSKIEIQNAVDQLFATMIEISNDYLIGTPSVAQHKLSEYLKFNKPICEWILKVDALKIKSKLYRMRGNDEYFLFPKEEMFHISFDKRHLVSNQRYSVPGFPSLYLGSSLYVCWEELNRPNLEKMNCTGYKSTKTLKIISMDIPKWNELKSVESFLRIGLFLICTIIVKEKNASFKFEYVVSQLIMQCLIEYNNHQNTLSSDKIDGIKYLSSKYYNTKSSVYKNIRSKMINYVFPIREAYEDNIISKGYSDYIKGRFIQTETISPFYQHLKSGLFIQYPYLNQYDTSVFKKHEIIIDNMSFSKVDDL